MNVQDITDGLAALGFTGGYAIGGDPAEIILWENEQPQPSLEEIEAASVQGAYDREYAQVQEIRRQAYMLAADPLFFGFQRGDNTEQEWLDAVQAVKDAHPYPVKETK